MTTYPIRYEEKDSFKVCGARAQFNFHKDPTGFTRAWTSIGSSLTRIAHKTGDDCYGLILRSTPEGDMDYLAGVQVGTFDQENVQFGRAEVPKSNYIVVTYKGPVSGIGNAWNWLMAEWTEITDRKMSMDKPSFEFYSADYDPSQSESVIEIWYPIEA